MDNQEQENIKDTEQNIEQKPKSIFKKMLSVKIVSVAWEFFKIAFIAFLIVAPIRYFLFQPFIVSGESMAPSFGSGDYLIVDEISYRFSEPQRGDVIVFSWPKDEKQRFIKRIIGLPMETVDVSNGQVKIIENDNTFILDEKYLPSDLKTYGDANITLQADEFFVLGDNRERSYDSRSWGVVPRENIIGKAFLRIFPVSALSAIYSPSY